jgi:hypothetical protein
MMRFVPTALFLATMLAAVSSAVAGENGAVASKDLPGVDKSYSIVMPPKPEPDQEADGNPLKRRIGNWDVTVSGSVSVELGFGERPENRRR